MSVASRVAEAICRANPYAGQLFDSDEEQTIGVRASNLLEKGYVVEGDPYGWSDGAAATVLMEQQGGAGDCHVPFEYYDVSSIDQTCAASAELGDLVIEFVGAAVCSVHRFSR